MKKSLTHLPSGIKRGLDFLIADHWTPEQALAVFELLSDLRARVWMRYSVDLYDQISEQRSPPNDMDIEDILGEF
ncbi:MAG: hypothetical protein ACREYA_19700 [Cupriavidus necator]